MADWAPVLIGTLLFLLLSPGFLFQMPANGQLVGFANKETSGTSIFIHTVFFFCLMTLFIRVIGIHIYVHG